MSGSVSRYRLMEAVFCHALCLTTDVPLMVALELSGLMAAFCSHPSELALCSPQRTLSPAPGSCLWRSRLPRASAWLMSSVSLEPQSERLHRFVRALLPPVIFQLVWLSEPSRLTLFSFRAPLEPLFLPPVKQLYNEAIFNWRPFSEHWIGDMSGKKTLLFHLLGTSRQAWEMKH